VLLHNVTRSTNSILSRIQVNIANLINVTCDLIATSMIFGRLDCIENTCGEVVRIHHIVQSWWVVELGVG
jgi:hypothetical protein